MNTKNYLALFAILPLAMMALGPAVIEDAFAMQSEGNPTKKFGSATSNIVCGGVLCSELSLVETSSITETQEKTVKIEGLDVFYLEAGSRDNPTILLLHGFPTSSHMFRNLVPALADEFHVVAPDYIGYGRSSMPTVDEFDYTFGNQAQIVDKFTDRIGLEQYTMYMMDYGGPIGFRLFDSDPDRVEGFIIQNANAYEEGLEEFWDDWKAWWADKTPENEQKLHYLVQPDTTKWQYQFGTRNPEAIDPSTWMTDQAGLDRPGNVAIQLAMAYDYRTNIPLYSQWQEQFREHQPPTLIVWGENDYIFPPSGAHPYERDLNNVEKHIINTGHFVLEEDLDFVAEEIRDFMKSQIIQ